MKLGGTVLEGTKICENSLDKKGDATQTGEKIQQEIDQHVFVCFLKNINWDLA